MKTPGSLAAILVFGLAAALCAHVSLQAFDALGLGAFSYGAHGHGSVLSTICVETLMLVLLVCLFVRDAINEPSVRIYRLPSQESFVAGAIVISIVAVATLFGMECSESGSAAFGAGWIGGGLLPGIPLLAIAIVLAVCAYWALTQNRLSVFKLLVKILVALVVLCTTRQNGSRRPFAPHRPYFRRSLSHGLHARFRGPPLLTA